MRSDPSKSSQRATWNIEPETRNFKSVQPSPTQSNPVKARQSKTGCGSPLIETNPALQRRRAHNKRVHEVISPISGIIPFWKVEELIIPANHKHAEERIVPPGPARANNLPGDRGGNHKIMILNAAHHRNVWNNPGIIFIDQHRIVTQKPGTQH